MSLIYHVTATISDKYYTLRLLFMRCNAAGAIYVCSGWGSEISLNGTLVFYLLYLLLRFQKIGCEIAKLQSYTAIQYKKIGTVKKEFTAMTVY